MLFGKEILAGIQNGAVTLAFRRWRRPTVRGGSTLMTPVGKLSIRSVSPGVLDSIATVDAHLAGNSSQEELLAELTLREGGEIYHIELGPLLPDPRLALRASAPTAEERPALQRRLQRLDSTQLPGPGPSASWKSCVPILASAPEIFIYWLSKKRGSSSEM
jgi:hypothetical protein